MFLHFNLILSVINDGFFEGLRNTHESPYWAYGGAIIFPIAGIYLLKKWKKVRATSTSAWDKAVIDAQYRNVGVLLIVCGIIFIVGSIYLLFFK